MKRIFPVFIAGLLILSLSACSSGGETAHTLEEQNASGVDSSYVKSISGVNEMGALSPEDALEYMKNTPNLVIVEVNAPEWKLSTGFTGAMYIPYTEMAERYDEIPKNRPVLLHCGCGIVSVDAYEILQEKRPDIPELSYIAGAPLIRAYNEWLAGQESNS